MIGYTSEKNIVNRDSPITSLYLQECIRCDFFFSFCRQFYHLKILKRKKGIFFLFRPQYCSNCLPILLHCRQGQRLHRTLRWSFTCASCIYTHGTWRYSVSPALALHLYLTKNSQSVVSQARIPLRFRIYKVKPLRHGILR